MKIDTNNTPSVNAHVCYYCKESIIGKRRDAKFCSARCRQQNYLDKKEDPRIKYLAKEYYNVLSREPGNHDKEILGLINKNLSEIDDPLSRHKHHLYYYFFMELGYAKSFIEQLFTFEKQESVSQEDLQELLTAISKKILELKNENNRMTKFLIALLNDIAKFIRNKLSEMKIESLSDSKFVIQETKVSFGQSLIYTLET